MKILPRESTLLQNLDSAELDVGPQIQLCDFKSLGKKSLLEQDPKNSLVISLDSEPEQIVDVMAHGRFQSFVQKRGDHFARDVNLSAEILLHRDHYFANGGRNILPEASREIEVKFSTTSEKSGLKSQIMHFIEETKSQNVIESGDAIVEELYMNSMFDAPQEASRQGQINCSYEMGVFSTLRVFQGSDRLVISCEDPFGSLDLQKLVKRMDHVFKKGAGEAINLRGEGGAGLGCVIMFNHCESLFLGVIPGQKTLVSCVIPLGLSYRQRGQIKKSLHLIKK